MRKRYLLPLCLFCALFFGETRGEISSASLLADDDVNIALPYNNGDFNKALFESRRTINEGRSSGHLNEATILKDLYDYSKAVRVLENLPESLKHEPGTLMLLGRIYYLGGRENDAINFFKQFLKNERAPQEKAFAWLNLALSYEKIGDEHNAIKSLKESITLSPDDYLSHVKLGGLYKKKGKRSEAINEFETADRIDSSDSSIRRELAFLLEKEKRLEEALILYRKLSLSNPEDQVLKRKVDEIYRELGRDYADREKKTKETPKPIFVTASNVSSSVKIVRIGLAQGQKSIELRSSADFTLKKVNGQNIGTGHGGRFYLAAAQSDRTINFRHNAEPPLSTAMIHDGLIIDPVTDEATTTIYGLEKAKGEYWSKKEDRTYRGKIEIRVTKSGLSVVNIVNLEEYLYGVVPSEMPSSWPKEALKAQAVAARSEALSKLGRHQGEGFDLCDEVHCQAYRGVSQENERVNGLVDETRGQIMTFGGKPVDALYSSACGGHTQDNIFGAREEVSYLKGSPDYESPEKSFPLSPYALDQWLRFPDRNILCNLPGVYPRGQFRWVRTYGADEMNLMANKLGDVGEVKEITILKRETSGHISSLKITGTKSSIVIDKELAIRKALGNLRSSLFKLEIKKSKDGLIEEFIFFGGGWGHGVGMCQSGSCGLAKSGKNFQEILRRYFNGVKLEKIY